MQTNDGKWRSEEQWPPADMPTYTTTLKGGSYVDTAQSMATGWDAWSSLATDNGTNPSIPRSSPASGRFPSRCPYDIHLSGEPTAAIDVTTALPNANLVVDVYDLSQDANGDWTGPLVTRQGHSSGTPATRRSR